MIVSCGQLCPQGEGISAQITWIREERTSGVLKVTRWFQAVLLICMHVPVLIFSPFPVSMAPLQVYDQLVESSSASATLL